MKTPLSYAIAASLFGEWLLAGLMIAVCVVVVAAGWYHALKPVWQEYRDAAHRLHR